MRKVLFFVSVFYCSISSFGQVKSSSQQLKNANDSLSYAIGVDLGENFKLNDLDNLDLQILIKAMQDQYSQKALLDVESARQYVQTELMQRGEVKAIAGKETGKKFLEENKKKAGVKTTASGLQYKVIKEGTGIKPSAIDTVVVHYHGTLIDGTVFDSSVDRGETIEFPLNQVIQGWTEGLQLMSSGSKYIFYIPENLAYAQQAMGTITPYSTLVFEVELFDVKKAR